MLLQRVRLQHRSIDLCRLFLSVASTGGSQGELSPTGKLFKRPKASWQSSQLPWLMLGRFPICGSSPRTLRRSCLASYEKSQGNKSPESFSRMRSEGSHFTLGGQGCVRQKLCLCPQPVATVRNRLRDRRKALLRCECIRSGPESVSSWLALPQLLVMAFAKEVWRRSYHGVCKGGVSVSDLWRRSYHGVCRGSVSVSDLWLHSYNSVCRGRVCVSGLCQIRVSYKSVK